VNLVSRDGVTTRDYWNAWMEHCGRPHEVRYYDSLDNLDRSALDEGEKLLIDFAEANIEISTHRWCFETRAMDALRARGLLFRDVTVDSLRVCLEHFLAQSSRARAYMDRLLDLPTAPPRIVEMSLRVASSM
jgi:hypothetical protein